MKSYIILTILLSFLPHIRVFPDYPEIVDLDYKDILFKQIQEDIQSYFKTASRVLEDSEEKRKFPPLQIFRYQNPNNMDIFSLAARVNLSYDTLATLNGLDNPAALQGIVTVLIPNLPGIFVPLNPKSGFQEILYSLRLGSEKQFQEIVIGDRKKFLFFLGDNFHSLERAYFLNILFRFPLSFGKLTSRYGYRTHPFTGHRKFHHGIDIAAPEGTDVFAARDGIIVSIGNDPALGNYIQIGHEGGYQTVYGHLSVINVSLKQKVSSGMIIGEVGITGMSTGPHLHFEIRRKGSVQDPVPLLPKSIKRSR